MNPVTGDFTADWITDYGAHWLTLMADMRERPVQALEIGSYEGMSACWMLENLLTHPSSWLMCVDPWDGQDATLGARTCEAEARFDANVKTYGIKVRKWKSSSLAALTAMHSLPFSRRFDLIYVDGCHEGLTALTDLVLCWPLLAIGGWLIFDDYGRDDLPVRVQPKQAWDAFVSVQPPGSMTVRFHGRQVLARKESP